MKTYKLTTGDKAGKIAAALVQMCQVGAVGEPLIRSGVSQGAFALFLAKLAILHAEAGRSAEQIAEVFELVSGGNASAARQALGDCTIEEEGSKPMSVTTFWNKNGGGRTAPNISILNLGS